MIAMRGLEYRRDRDPSLVSVALSILGDVIVILLPFYPEGTRSSDIVPEELVQNCFGMTLPDVKILDWMDVDKIGADI